MTFRRNIFRVGLAASLAIGATSHSYLYIHGYRHIPTIGTAFLIQASVSFALALLIVAGGPAWLRSAAAAVAAEALTVLLWAASFMGRRSARRLSTE